MRWVSRKPKRSRQVDACGRIGGSGVERGSLGHQTRRVVMLGSFVLVVEINYESHASSVEIGVISGDEGPPRSSPDNSVEEMGVCDVTIVHGTRAGRLNRVRSRVTGR
jgi:hypothetical protein